MDNELAIALRQEEEDQQKAYQDQLRKDEELAMKLQAEWGSENAKVHNMHMCSSTAILYHFSNTIYYTSVYSI